jgi:hypothetical protein
MGKKGNRRFFARTAPNAQHATGAKDKASKLLTAGIEKRIEQRFADDYANNIPVLLQHATAKKA